MSVEQIRGSLLSHAQELPSAQREAFLHIFTTADIIDEAAEDALGQTSPDLRWPVDDDPLLEEIDAFVDRVESGAYFEGFGWDPEIYEERSFGNESWVWEFDDLFAGAQDAFLQGNPGIARAAYQRLLGAFALDEEVGTFSGPEPATEMLDTDISEAQARYLRTIYETTPAEERAEALIGDWFNLPCPADTSLAAVRESRRQDLPDLEDFLSAWITALRSSGREGSQVRKLLTEATERSVGIDGLAELARQAGSDQADLYLEWVQALRRADRYTDAANASREALEVLESEGSARARIAEVLAELFRGEAGQEFAARRSAWRADPTRTRLVTLHQAAISNTENGATEAIATELRTLEEAGNLDRLHGGLRAALMLLAGRISDAAQLLNKPSEHLVTQPEREMLVPYLLASGCGGPKHPEWASTQLAGLLSTVDRANTWAWPKVSPHEADTPSLAQLLTEQITTQTDDAHVLSKRLDTAVQEVTRQVDAIVSNKFRGQYASVAHLLICSAEALTLANRDGSGLELVASLRARYPRHVAFQRELDAALKKTSLVTATK